MHINSINIKNFRVFDNLVVEDFGQINIILGKNNSGKTTLMEAILLTVSSTYPTALFNLNQIREIGERNLASIQGFFHGLSFANAPLIEAEFDNRGLKHKQRIEIEATSGSLSSVSSGSQSDSKFEPLISFTPITSINQINIITTFLINGNRIENKILFDLDNRVSVSRHDYVDQSMSALFLASNATEELALVRVGYLKKIKRDQDLVNILRHIDEKIINIEVLGDKLYFDVEGIGELLPFSLMGDGIKKIVSVLASAIDTTPSTLVLVDEIENGLHYSAHLKLWDALLTIARESGTQLFVTSHSIETLRYLNEALLKHADMQSKVRCFDIVKTKKMGYQAYKYTYEGFAGALENETEIRL
jgi:AAA15 family ATPase/GTPase